MPFIIAGIAGLVALGYAADQVGDAAEQTTAPLNRLLILGAVVGGVYLLSRR